MPIDSGLLGVKWNLVLDDSGETNGGQSVEAQLAGNERPVPASILRLRSRYATAAHEASIQNMEAIGEMPKIPSRRSTRSSSRLDGEEDFVPAKAIPASSRRSTRSKKSRTSQVDDDA